MSRKITHIHLFVAAVKSLGIGLGLTLKHFFRSIGLKRRAQVGVMNASYFHQPDGIVTNLYPFESIPVPDNGRYRLHNEIDDCIVCDLCAKVCPVNCIDIEPIKSPVEISKTSDGSTKRIFAAKFDIDMAKCCYCGLCTTVCPTECLTMTKTYDFSEYDVNNMVYHFAEMSPSEAVVKKEEMEVLAIEEKAKKAATATPKVTTESNETSTETIAAPKPAFKPKVTIPAKKPVTDTPVEQTETPSSATPVTESTTEATDEPAAPKPVFKPKVMIPAKKPVTDLPAKQPETANTSSSDSPATESTSEIPVDPKPVYKPKPIMKPAIPKKPEGDASSTASSEDASAEVPKSVAPKPVMKPIMKPVIPKKKENEEGGENA